MPSVYEYRHVELDKVGRGKRVLKPPGGEASDIFGGTSPSSTPGSTPGSTTPTSGKSRRGSSDSGSEKASGGSNTQDRLFGGEYPSPPSVGDVTPRRVVDRMKSNIFAGGDGDQIDRATPSPASPSKLGARRNPITGEVVTSSPSNGFHGSPQNGSPSPRCYRNPPGGKSSGIF